MRWLIVTLLVLALVPMTILASTGDVTEDMVINLADLQYQTMYFGDLVAFDNSADQDEDGDVDVFDVVFVASRWGTDPGYPSPRITARQLDGQNSVRVRARCPAIASWCQIRGLQDPYPVLAEGAVLEVTVDDTELASGEYTYGVRYFMNGQAGPETEFSVLVEAVDQPVDTTPPVISTPLPTTTLPAGSQSASLSVTTDEPADCRFSATDGSYDSLTTQFSTTGSTAHSHAFSVNNGQSYTLYVRCQDSAGNANQQSAIIDFSVANPTPSSGDWTSDVGLIWPDGIEPGQPDDCEATAPARCWWVDAQAPDGGNGSFDSPYNSFEEVAGYWEGKNFQAGLLRAGDHLYVTGTFRPSDEATGEKHNILIQRSWMMGPKGDPLVIKSWKGRPRAVFDGEDAAGLAIDLRAGGGGDNSAVLIQNIEFKRYLGTAVFVGDAIDWANLKSLYIHDIIANGAGTSGAIAIYMRSDLHNFTVENSLMHDNVRTTDPGGSWNNVGGISITSENGADPGSVLTIRNNLIYNDYHAIRHKHSGNVLMRMYHNIIHDSRSALYLRMARTEVFENLVYNNDIFIHLWDDNRQADSEYFVHDNTVYNTGTFLSAYSDEPPFTRAMHWYNNIYARDSPVGTVYNFRRWSSESGVNLTLWTFNNNLYDFPSADVFMYHRPIDDPGTLELNFDQTMAHIGETGYIRAGALLTDPETGDFSLAPGSPAISAGVGGTDMGALAYSGPSDATPPMISNPLPSGTLDTGTSQTTLRVTTNEAATCKYGNSDVRYSNLPNEFSSTGATAHSQSISVTAGTSYTYYVRCEDSSGNQNPQSTQISFSVQTGTVSPVLSMDFSDYASTDELMNDCETWNCVADHIGKPSYTTGRVVLDESVAPPGATKSMRYDYNHGSGGSTPQGDPAPGCNSITISRGLPLPENVQEVWAEFWVRWSDNFRTTNDLCRPNDHKLIFGDTEGGLNGRWELKVGADSGPSHSIQVGRPWGDPRPYQYKCGTTDAPGARGNVMTLGNGDSCIDHGLRAVDMWDGEWHQIRLQFKASTTGQSYDGEQRVWIDGALVHEGLNFRTAKSDDVTADRIQGFSFAHNKDDGPADELMSLWWGPIKYYTEDPGW